ncbi:methionine-R-sulfoxide reductase B1-A-like protein [Lates japonicus]|uniref:Methionine-R-sulfoxide reductase B1-A-like protein n=1 Tax=Lates japonicus TaxID=270547 RepID=A0AAD3MP33_LATJO|nr:methionine-R-sulfoxide reductase B1-A-like protein [Lates japonicus]
MSFCQFFGGEIYKDHFKPGMYVCSKCNHPLFSSRSKFAHSSPWPAFTDTIREDSVTKMMETLTAYKVLCGKCGNGLGHEFVNDGPEEGVLTFLNTRLKPPPQVIPAKAVVLAKQKTGRRAQLYLQCPDVKQALVSDDVEQEERALRDALSELNTHDQPKKAGTRLALP